MAMDKNGRQIHMGDWVFAAIGVESSVPVMTVARVIALRENLKDTQARGAFIDDDGHIERFNFNPKDSTLVMRADWSEE